MLLLLACVEATGCVTFAPPLQTVASADVSTAVQLTTNPEDEDPALLRSADGFLHVIKWRCLLALSGFPLDRRTLS